ncbi:gephyrin-like molybdotransferase Glp [uncultured Winogradskyella sp.]|uniref:molybdopterin molybdotransferase MoeA n=1 Tax=uncultured Winogradskyella sp. TaxID=395353 RepID=UPI00261581A5|nr:gephyrin-like molybdotransferase Glp [uncultured Winogradskyella sp.]
MISVKDALGIIEKVTVNLQYKNVDLSNALGFVLANDVLSPIDMPPFRQSAMDGYALKWSGNSKYKNKGESKAGDSANLEFKEGEAIRIFTGALVPDVANTVVIQEHVEKVDNDIIIKQMPSKYANIRKKGEQIKTGDIALKKGTLLNAAAIGFLACLGISKVRVFKKPKVGILVTGSELQQAGSVLKQGKIYESNSIMLKSALKAIGIKDAQSYSVKDDYISTKKIIESALETNDVLLISGGISVGDYDFVKQALEDNNVDELFYKINQKPGKPLWFGKTNKTFVFALPGNPASALTCFYIYVQSLLKTMCGYRKVHLERLKAKCITDIKNASAKTLFLKATLNNNNEVKVHQGQSSAMLHTYALSNALVCIDETVTELKAGDEVECLKLEMLWR